MSSISAITHQLSNKPRNVEDYVSLIVHHVTQTLLKKSQASNQEVDDAIRAEVMAVIRSGHAGEDAESIVELERRVLHRLDLSNANSSMRDINETTKGTTMDEWALLAKYAALEEQEEGQS